MSGPILIIEDNAQNRYLLAFLLESHGYEVHAVANGAAGIQLALDIGPSLILLDIQLPGMNGYQVARALRRSEALRDTPIVAVTSHAMPGDREKALAAGCNAYIEKPIDAEAFVRQIQGVVGGGEIS